MERTLDRLVSFDERSREYPIRGLMAASPKPRSRVWSCPTWLDQGTEGACVGFSWSHELAAYPKRVAGIDNRSALAVYHAAQELDEWPGRDYSGTSVLAGAKAVKALGQLKEYRWAFGLDDMILALGYKGPVVLGVPWYEGMYEPDAKGYLHVEGEEVGGHAILCRGVAVKARRFLLHNSWGKSWGRNGMAYVSFDDMAKLLANDGEVCVPVVR